VYLSKAIDLNGSVHSLLKCDKIYIMRAVFIALMTITAAGFWYSLNKAIDISEASGITYNVILLWVLCIVLIGVFVVFTKFAFKYGKMIDNWKMPKG